MKYPETKPVRSRFNLRKSLLLMALVSVIAAVAGLFYVAAVNEVDTNPTDEDRQTATIILGKAAIPPARTAFEAELATIRTVQQAVLTVAPVNEGIPFDYPREPKDILEQGRGLCYDRSRAIEKILRTMGFTVRHVSIYSVVNGSKLKSLLTPNTPSHAVSEVLTSKGWLVVDSNSPWLSVDVQGVPVSLAMIRHSALMEQPIDWATHPPSTIYTQPFVFVCGLYSRHGRFYPPYSRWPDLNYQELMSCL